jgi:hypothetical protein
VITVYFNNGAKAELPSGTHAKLETENLGTVLVVALVCRDAREQIVGVFAWDQIIGYDIAQASPGQAQS